MWLTINILILIVGVCFLVYGNHIDRSENTEALMFFIFGVIFLICSGVSGLLLWTLG